MMCTNFGCNIAWKETAIAPSVARLSLSGLNGDIGLAMASVPQPLNGMLNITYLRSMARMSVNL